MGRTVLSISFAVLLGLSTGRPAQAQRSFEVRLDPAVRDEPVTGRVLVYLTDRTDVEPRLAAPFLGAYYMNAPRVIVPGRFSLDYAPLWGEDVEALAPGQACVIGEGVRGYPFESLRDVPPGQYTVQALLNVYTKVTPAHGHTLWLHMDQWEGQQPHLSPGNLISEPMRITVEAGAPFHVELALSRKIPPIEPLPDSKVIKRIKIRSRLLSDFWGTDMYIGANVLLPKGYDEHPDAHYPLLINHNHFWAQRPYGVPDEEPTDPRRRGTWDGWMAKDTPRFIAITIQHPTPFYDDSYLINSPNQGPYDDAFNQELLPLLEQRFRLIRKPYARVMEGGSTGGGISALQQIHHPDIYGGAWVFCPDWVDYRNVSGVNMYEDDSMFDVKGYPWVQPERVITRTVEGQPRLTVRQFSHFLAVLGTHGRTGEFIDEYSACFGPVGEDGYPVPPWDYVTGKIDHAVVESWRDSEWSLDLTHYLKAHWKEVGPKVAGKLFFLCGDMDEFFLNESLYLLEDYLETTTDPYYGGSFRWGRPHVGHGVVGMGVDPYPWALFKEMAAQIRKNAPPGEDTDQWNYE